MTPMIPRWSRIAAAVVFSVFMTGTALPADSEFLIDLAVKHQVIDHFGANDAWSFQKIGEWSDGNKSRIADLLYTTDKGIGLSFCRFYVGGGINRKTIRDDWRTAETFEVTEGVYDWNRLGNERWFLRAAKARGVRQFGMTFYSPPPRLTRNGLSNHGDDKTSTTNLKPGAEAAYARYMADIVAHFRDHPDAAERIEFDRVFPLNEPQWDWQDSQEGNRASNEDMRRINLALQDELRKKNLRTRIAGPESGSIPGMYETTSKRNADYGNYLDFLTKDPQLARGFGGVLTYHSYWSDQIPGQLLPHREALAAALAKHPGWKLWQSEYCVMEGGRDLGMDTALRVARVIHCDLTVTNASAWQWWLAVSRGHYKDGLIYTDWKKPGDPENILPSKTLWALGNYSRFIRPCMRRVEVVGKQDIQGLMVSAYLDQPNKHVAIVLVNMADQAAQATFKLARDGKASTTPLRVTPHLTTEKADLQSGEALEASAGLTVPPRSVMTLVSLP